MISQPSFSPLPILESVCEPLAEQNSQVESQAVRTCRLVTLGCKVNQYETQLVKEALLNNGYREAGENEVADLCVVNTCTVTNEGDSKSRSLIRQLAKRNPGTKTLVMGCYATRAPEEVAKLPSVFEVVPDKRELPDVLLREGVNVFPNGISQFDGRRRAYVKVQDGCILRCTYCIIPQVRPGLRTRSAQDIEEEVRRLIDHGHKEIILTGIHIGHYGVETSRAKSGLSPFRFWHLLEQLDRIPGDWQMRLTSMEAGEMNDDFINAIADCEHLCPQFHPALQSGSETVLRRMRRRYSVGRFLERLEKIREKIHNPAFSTDIIVGFPGETDQEHQETVEFCRQAQFMKLHLFPFSRRKGTPAADFPHQIPGNIQQQRMEELAQVEHHLAHGFYQNFVGEPLEIMVESVVSEKDKLVFGTDRRYIPVVVSGTASDIGQYVYATGERVEQSPFVAPLAHPLIHSSLSLPDILRAKR